MTIQAPSLILPAVWSQGTETELLNDLAEHTSVEFSTKYLRDKTLFLMAAEVVTVAAPGNILWWVELSPYLSTTSNAYWAAIGGGGNGVAPTAPNIVVASGVNGTFTPDMINWNMHSEFARVVVQCPVNAGLATGDLWAVQVLIGGRTP